MSSGHKVGTCCCAHVPSSKSTCVGARMHGNWDLLSVSSIVACTAFDQGQVPLRLATRSYGNYPPDAENAISKADSAVRGHFLCFPRVPSSDRPNLLPSRSGFMHQQSAPCSHASNALKRVRTMRFRRVLFASDRTLRRFCWSADTVYPAPIMSMPL